MKFYNFIKLKHLEVNSFYGEIAQVARAWDSYPQGRWFESTSRYRPWQELIQLDFRVMGEVNATVAHESVLV